MNISITYTPKNIEEFELLVAKYGNVAQSIPVAKGNFESLFNDHPLGGILRVRANEKGLDRERVAEMRLAELSAKLEGEIQEGEIEEDDGEEVF